MNYEEVIKNRDQRVRHIATTPLGPVYRQQIDNKYTNVLTIRPDLVNDCIFTSDLNMECEKLNALKLKNHITCAMMVKGTSVLGLKLSNIKITSLENLLVSNPSVVAEKNFVKDILNDVFDTLEKLHEKGIYHICLDPQSVFVKPETHQVMFITHGSFYLNIEDRRKLFKGMEEFVAPEILEGHAADERSDVYTMGKFIAHLYRTNDITLEIKKVINKATNAIPAERYLTISEMRRDILVKRNLRLFVTSLAVVLVGCLVIIGGMSTLFETPSDIEYVKPAPKRSTDDLVERGIDPLTELGLIANDTIGELTPEQQKEQEEYRKKNEEIFKRRYRQAAIRLLGKVYDKKNMNQSQTIFMRDNQEALEELARLQTEYGSEAGLDDARSQKIASQLIEEISNTLK